MRPIVVADVSNEQNYYNINTANIQAVSTDHYPNNNGILNPGNSDPDGNSTLMYRLNSSNKIGLGITLKVMSGDMVSIFWKELLAKQRQWGRQQQRLARHRVAAGANGAKYTGYGKGIINSSSQV